MLSAFKSFLSPSSKRVQAHAVYARLVTQARQPFFYREAGVPDTLDGRFEMVLLHLFLVLRRLQREPGKRAEAFACELTQAFFGDMDRSLREMGVSDTGVGKRVKKMGAAFYGRLDAYTKALGSGDFNGALKRNAYGTVEAADEAVARLAEYVRTSEAALGAQPADEIIAGKMAFPLIQ